MLSERRFAEVVAHFDATMSTLMPEAVTEQTWDGLLGLAGAFQHVVGANVTPADPYIVVTVTTAFQNLLINIDISFDADQKVAGLFFNPAAAYAPPDYADPSAFTEHEAVVGAPPWELPGTLTLPNGDGPFPAVVLVHGSGPNDRDETIGPNKPFKDLAWGLASRGIAVLRYEKRTAHYQQAMVAIEQQVTIHEEAVVDARAAVALLRATPGVDPDRVYLLGHSLGGTLAPLIATEADGLAGIIIAAGTTRPLEDHILEQAIYISGLDGVLSPEEQTAIDAIEASVEKIKALDFAPNEVVLGAAKAYWQSLADYDISAAAAGLDLPVLVLQGGRDYQVPPAELDRWQDALASNPDAAFLEYPALNHLFIAGQGLSSPQEYLVHGSVALEVIEDIAAWLQ
jgi:dienelactone hydrolase